MRLGYHIGHWRTPPEDAAGTIAEAERLGYESIWTGEAYGSDCLTPLAWWGRDTARMRLGTNILQMAARTPTATAMAALTLDHLSGGRFVLGLGVSGPQVVEGWYGQPFSRPLDRTREYVDVVRAVWARRGAVTSAGEFYRLPHPGGTGLGKPLKTIVHPLRTEIPLFLAAQGPRNVALAAEIADGWLPWFFSPAADVSYRAALAEGFARRGGRSGAEGFEVAAAVPVVVEDSVAAAVDRLRPQVARYVGGMGAPKANFHRNVFVRLGYEAECVRIQRLYQERRIREACGAVSRSLVEEVALVGPVAKIRDDLQRWRGTVITTLLVDGDLRALRAVAEVV